MISQKQLLDMIATDAIEVWGADKKSSKTDSNHSEELPPINYNLRLIRYEGGRMEWKD